MKVSRSKLHNLPYSERLKLALKQDDFIYEVNELLNDNPHIDSTEATQKLVIKCSMYELCTKVFYVNRIDYKILFDEIETRMFVTDDRIVFSSIDFQYLVNSSVKYKHVPDVQKGVNKIIRNVCKHYNNNAIEVQEWRIISTLERLSDVQGFNMSDLICEELLPHIKDKDILFLVNKLSSKIKDKDIKNKVITALNIADIII